jgi:hypothetical protein
MIEAPGLLDRLARLLQLESLGLIDVPVDDLGPLLGHLIALGFEFENPITAFQLESENIPAQVD